MNKLILPLICLSIASTLPVASALSPRQVQWCQDTASSFSSRQASILQRSEERMTLADEAEAAGEAWENAEALRNFSADNAAEADALKASFDEAKARFYSFENRLREDTNALNRDANEFNSICAD